MIESTLNYMAPMAERPRYYLYPPPDGESWRNNKGDRRRMAIHDARDLVEEATLDREGFAIVRHETKVTRLFDPEVVRAEYFAEMERLVARHTGAQRVLAFDHNVRSRAMAEHGENDAQTPVKYAHNDYTLASGPQRVRDLMGEEAESLLQRRFSVVNVWKPIVGPVQESPLAFCDAQTIDQHDLVPTDLAYRDRMGEVYSMTFSPRHRWFYYSAMQADEALLLKCYDSADGVARFTAHSAVDDPTTAPDAPARESIEVRTLAFFAE